MIRKTLFWLHLPVGVAAGLFIFIMAATGVVLSFERQITEFIDKGSPVYFGSSGCATTANKRFTRGRPPRRAGRPNPNRYTQ